MNQGIDEFFRRATVTVAPFRQRLAEAGDPREVLIPREE
jgi:hypothetical protein